MFRKPAFWVVAGLLFVTATWASIRGFPLAFPLVALDLRMDRSAALEAAEELASQRGWGPQEHRQAAMFNLDQSVQAYVELETGGNEAFRRLIEEGLFHPYAWQVRHFKPQEATETLISFTPTGEAYGFREKLPEDQEGAALDSDAARALAERGARAWPVDLSVYELVETSKEVRPSERIDHTFVYERSDAKLGEALYRLRLGVSGERFSELTHYVKVPEGFSRRYGEMRSFNEAIATWASLGMALVLGIIGCGVGLFVLLRQRWVLWKQPVLWGLLVGGLETAAYLSRWPLLWMTYDTAVSATNFTLQQLAFAAVQFIVTAALTTLVFMAGESLTRRAFPQQLQVWKLWSPRVASSPSVLGLTVAGFMLVSAFAVYEVILYYFAHRNLGWWSPSGVLADPNLLASYAPWLTAVGISLRAGLTEECLFRAVPIAGAALLGRRFGGQRLWIVGAVIFQAVLFGAGHANYPAQPAYARLVELILPALGWGVVYLGFGLLPVIVCHFAVDVVFIGLPIFASSAPGAWVHQAIAVALTLIPLWIVLAARWRRGRWEALDDSVLNGAWAPPALAETVAQPETPTRSLGLSPKLQKSLWALGVVGLVAWGSLGSFDTDAPPVTTGRAAVTAAARQTLAENDVELSEEWRELSRTDGIVDGVDRFVWQLGGAETYRELLGSYVWGPGWYVRYARFEGDVAERAEEFGVWTNGAGDVWRFMHRFPEARTGAALEEEEARALAHAALKERYGLVPESLEEVEATPEKQPERRDWRFVFRDPSVEPGGEGEARIAVSLAGGQLADSYRFVHLPEEWRRSEENRQSALRIVSISNAVALVLLFVAGAVFGIVRWSRGRFSSRAFFVSFAALAVMNLVGFFNMWPVVTAGFQTQAPWALQAGTTGAAGSLGILITAAATALLVGLAHAWLGKQGLPATRGASVAGWALGGLLVGLGVIAAQLGPDSVPIWPGTQQAALRLPLIAAVLEPVDGWITQTALLLLAVATLHAGTRGWSARRGLFTALALIFGLVLAGTAGADSVALWLVAGLLTGLVLLASYVLVLRHHLALLPLVTATMVVLDTLDSALQGGHSGLLGGSILGVILVLLGSYLWFGWLSGGAEQPPAEPTQT